MMISIKWSLIYFSISSLSCWFWCYIALYVVACWRLLPSWFTQGRILWFDSKYWFPFDFIFLLLYTCFKRWLLHAISYFAIQISSDISLIFRADIHHSRVVPISLRSFRPYLEDELLISFEGIFLHTATSMSALHWPPHFPASTDFLLKYLKYFIIPTKISLRSYISHHLNIFSALISILFH